MRKLNILKTLIDLFWFFSLLASVAMIIFIPYCIFHKGSIADLHLKINGEPIVDYGFATQFMLTLIVIAYGFFVHGIYQLRKLLRLFEKRIIFEQATIVLLYQIGRSFTISSLVGGIGLFVYNSFNHGGGDIDFTSGFSSFLFTLSLGLFFMVLSEVFTIAKNMKEENELTV